MLPGDVSERLDPVIPIGERYLPAAGKPGEDPFDLSHQRLCRLAIDLQLLQVNADPLVEIQFSVVEQSPRGIGMPIDDGDPVDAQAFEP